MFSLFSFIVFGVKGVCRQDFQLSIWDSSCNLSWKISVTSLKETSTFADDVMKLKH